MTPSHLIISIIIFLWIEGVYLSKDKQVFQSPAEVLVQPNVPIKLTLTHTIPSYDTILWYQRSAGDTSLKLVAYISYKNPYIEKPFEGLFNVSGDGEKTGFLHILKPKHPDDSGEYFGAARRQGANTQPAYFGQGTKLTVLETDREITKPTSVKILEPSIHECRNNKDKKRKKTLVCVASGFYPDHVSVSWTINGINVNDNVATDDAAHKNGSTYRITSRLRVYAPEWENPGNTFKCTVTFFSGTKNTFHHSNEISGVEAQGKGMTRDTFMTTTQNFKLTYAVFIAKSCVYGVFVGFLVWKLQRSGGKQKY